MEEPGASVNGKEPSPFFPGARSFSKNVSCVCLACGREEGGQPLSEANPKSDHTWQQGRV